MDYILITPARNEAAFIEKTIQSVIAQSVLPLKWVIVSDGSTDATSQIVTKYQVDYAWIELVRMPERQERHFSGKVHAFNAGYERVRGLPYDIIGNLDADVTFDKEYVAFLLDKFRTNSRLGVAGTPFREGEVEYDYRFTSIEHVSGACQLFRRACFEEIGGYKPIKLGGVDLVAVITARMKGWQTRTFPEKHCTHHRKMGTAKRSVVRVAWMGGQGDYRLGTHPLWEVSRCIYQMTKRPLLVAGCLRLAGFTLAMMLRFEKVVPEDFVRFRRNEQMRRLREFVKRVLTLSKLNPQKE